MLGARQEDGRASSDCGLPRDPKHALLGRDRHDRHAERRECSCGGHWRRRGQHAAEVEKLEDVELHVKIEARPLSGLIF